MGLIGWSWVFLVVYIGLMIAFRPLGADQGQERG